MVAAACPILATAAGAAEDAPAAIRAQLAQLQEAQLRISAQQREIDQAILKVQAQLMALEQAQGKVPPLPAPPPVQPAGPEPSPLSTFGDFRVRGQGDYSNGSAPTRNSMQVRGRFGAVYQLSELVTLGARVLSGDPDDPQSGDVQLSNWDDDIQTSLDMAYLQMNFDDVQMYAGKIPQPFVRTDMVWDVDVNPQGVAGVYRHALAGGAAFRASALFFMIDEQVAAHDSTMLGAQVGYQLAPAGAWRADVNAAYYDYSLRSIAGADAGDFRSNRRDAQGRYLSDFNLLDIVASATWSGLGARWPLRAGLDYVRNLAAPSGMDTGYAADMTLGRVAQPGDWRLGMGYSTTGTDAVLAAFSADSISVPTDYRLHTLSLDYRVAGHTTLNAVWYHYRRRGDGLPGGEDWLDRVRLGFLVDF